MAAESDLEDPPKCAELDQPTIIKSERETTLAKGSTYAPRTVSHACQPPSGYSGWGVPDRSEGGAEVVAFSMLLTVSTFVSD